MEQCLFVLCCGELFLVLLGLDGLELRTHIVVVHLELQHLLIANGIGDDIRMQLPPEDACGRIGTQGIFWEDRGAREAKLVIPLELLLQVLLRLTELAAMALIENEDHLLVIDGKVAIPPHQIVELLDGGDNDLVIVLLHVPLQTRRVLGAVDAIRREALVFLHRLVIEVFAIHHEEHLIDKIQLGDQTRRLEAGEGLS